MDALARPPRQSERDRPVLRRRRRISPRRAQARLYLHFACESRTTRRLALMLDSLVRVSRRVGRVADATTDPRRRGEVSPSDSEPRASTEYSPRPRKAGRTDASPPPLGRRGTRLRISSLRLTGPYHPRAVTLRPKSELPSREASGRRRNGRGVRRALVR